jgi:hypothetical protein
MQRLGMLRFKKKKTMTRRWPFKKTPDVGASSSSVAKKNAQPLKKERYRPYMSKEIAQSCMTRTRRWTYATSTFLVGGTSTLGGYQSLRRLTVGGSGEIRHQRAILPPDLHEDPTFTMDSEWWDRPAYEPFPRRRSRLLDDEEYDYTAEVYLPQHVPWAPPPPEEEEA